MKIDLHVHSAERSWCCRAFEREQIESAIRAGLDAIVITDHNTCVSPSHLARLNEIYSPFKIFGGVEMTIVGKNYCNEDFIIIGLVGRDIERWNWSSDWVGMHQYVRSRGGFIMLAHAFRYESSVSLDTQRFPVDAIELYSNNITDNSREKIVAYAKKQGITRFFSNSDAHDTSSIGRYYNTIDGNPQTEKELVQALLNGEAKLHF